MRVLYIPHTSSPNSLATDHAYAWSTAFFSRWIRRDPTTVVYWPIPRKALTEQKGAFYKLKDLSANVKFIEMDMDVTQRFEQSLLQPELVEAFDAMRGKYHFDVCFCEKPGVLSSFLSQIKLTRRTLGAKFFVANQHYAMNADSSEFILYETDMNYYMNAAMCDAFLFGCAGRCVDSPGIFFDKLREYASSHLVLNTMSKARWVKPCTDMTEVAEIAKKGAPRSKDEFRIHYGFSVNMMFNDQKVFDAVMKYRMLSPRTRFVITTSSLSAPTGDLDKDWIESHWACPRLDFYQHALKSHVFVMWFHGTHGLNHGSVLEMSRLGVLPVFWKSAIPFPWNESYPFLFSGERDLLLMLKYVEKNYWSSTVQTQIQLNQKMLDELYEPGGACAYETILDDVVHLAQKKFDEFKRRAFVFQELLTDLPSPMLLSEIVKLIKEKSVVRVNLDHPSMGQYARCGTRDDLRLWLLQNGWTDTGGVDDPRLERVTT